MSGRHKMPPAGLRKAAGGPVENTEPAENTEPVESTEPASPEPPEPETVGEAEGQEATAVGAAAETEVADEASAEVPAETTVSPARRGAGLPVVLAAIALVLALASAVLRWLIVSQDESDTARAESVRAAQEITAQMLSYEPETVEEQLTAARDQMTGDFRGTYSGMIAAIIPAARAQQIAAVADVLRSGVVSAGPDSVEVVLFVNQSVRVGKQVPQRTESVVRATMVKEGDRWLLSEYEPVQM